jgi:acetylornithine deacetylase/succinyl-diaminopimelate desuccinylase-like protein
MADAVALLQQLIRFNTVNPPGNERAAQEHLAGLLDGAGLDVTLVGRTSERPNLVARLAGSGDGPTLCLLSHVDTVLADAGEWSHDPWSGDVADGHVWGRGAIDMKSQTAAEVSAMLRLAADGWRGRGDLLLVVLVDEEAGGTDGAQWICAEHRELVRADYVLNEGAGAVIPFGEDRVYGVCVAEKGVFRFKVIADGVAAHASMPKMGDNALLKLAPLIERLGATTPSYDVTEAPQAMLDGLGVSYEQLAARDPRLAVIVEPMLGVTFAPTKVHASDKINVLPSRAEVTVDCRVPPGLGRADAERRIVEVLGGTESGSDPPYRIEFTEQVAGNASALESPLMDVISRWVAREDPSARCVPTILPGFTDSRTWRATFPECVAYGFFPQRHMSLYESAPLVHGADERIDVRDLVLAAEFFEYAAREICG